MKDWHGPNPLAVALVLAASVMFIVAAIIVAIIASAA